MGSKRAHGWNTGSPENVISLASRRRAARPAETHAVFYLTQNGAWTEQLRSFPFLEIISIDGLLALKSRLIARKPDLIVVEAGIKWEDAVGIINTLASLSDAPVVLIYGPGDLKKKPDLLKRAFCVGLHDALVTPLSRESIRESLDVLIKLRRQALTP